MSHSARTGRSGGSGRVNAIDFWRGLVLIVIFINHIPGNVFEHITPRNFGFSDSAEAFVFIAGLSVALAWGRSVARGEVGSVIERAWRRTLLLYTVHLLLTFTAIALYANAFVLTGKEAFLLDHGRDVIFEEPGTALLGILFLGHQMGYYNILPLYILLVFVAPFFLLATWRNPFLTLTVSFVIYVIAQMPQVNLPSWPLPGLWFFNPFAWQFAFVSGMTVGVLARRDGLHVPASRPLMTISTVFVALAAVVASNAFGLVPGLFASVYELGGFDKTDMSVMRFAHFLALAYLLTQWRVGDRLLRFDWGQALALMGRHGLAIFSLGSVLSSTGLIYRMLTEGTRLENDTLTGFVVVPAGVMCLYWFARFLEGQSAPASAPATTGGRTAAA
ncbi:OpgC family protein [Pseudochelatococcus sp. B33]